MHALTAHDIVHIWETGLTQGPVDKALTLLSRAQPDMSVAELTEMTIGQRDDRLLAVRESLFGSRIGCYYECPNCGQRFEFYVEAAAIRSGGNSAGRGGDLVHEIAAEGYTLRFRLVNSRDIAAVAMCKDREAGRALLIDRCLLEARLDGERISPAELPEPILAELDARMAECDPLAEVLFNLDCLKCGKSWKVYFDVGDFLWTEIAAQARRLLSEIHVLAATYGWREADILALSARRRQFYLEMIGA